MASVAGHSNTNMDMPPPAAMQTDEFHDIHQYRPDSSPSRDTDVLDAIKDLDYEWNRPNHFYAENYIAGHARLSAPHQSSQPAPISPWKPYDYINNSNQRPLLTTDFNFQSPVNSALSPGFSGTASGSVAQTMSPSQMAFNNPSLDPAISGESARSQAGAGGSGSSSYSSHFTSVGNEHQPKRRSIASVSVESDSASSPSLSTRGRRSSCVEPGSARAIYLEKNRHAARKCRTKQKRHQEDLVEAARDMERKNKQLKAEVDFLKSDMRDLMGLIFQHGSCPDQRLSRYVQREANRLGQNDPLSRSPKVEPLDSPTMTSVSSPETI